LIDAIDAITKKEKDEAQASSFFVAIMINQVPVTA